MTPNRARLSNITRNVLNMHEALSAQQERVAKLEKRLEVMHAQMQTTTPKRKYTTIQDGSPEDKFVEDAEATTILSLIHISEPTRRI